MEDPNRDREAGPEKPEAGQLLKRGFKKSGNEYVSKPFRERLLLVLHFTLPFLLILVILGAGIYFAVFTLKKEEGNVLSPGDEGGAESLPLSRDAFVSAYLRERGGRGNLESLSSFRLSGELLVDKERFAFVLLKRVPDQALLTLHMKGYDMTIGIDGASAWRRIEVDGREAETAYLDEEERSKYTDLSQFFDPLTRLAFAGEGQILSLRRDRFEGRDCIRVELETEPEGQVLEVFVDPDTVHMFASVERLADGQKRVARFADYREVRGLPIPFTTELYLDDRRENTVRIDKARANVGLMSSLFDPPAGLGPPP